MAVLTAFSGALMAEEMREVAPKREMTPFNPVPRNSSEKKAEQQKEEVQEARPNLLERLRGIDLGRSGDAPPQVDYLAPMKQQRRTIDPRVERKVRVELDRRRNWLLEHAGRMADGGETASGESRRGLEDRDMEDMEIQSRNLGSLHRLNRALGREAVPGRGGRMNRNPSEREANSRDRNRSEVNQETLVDVDPSLNEKLDKRTFETRSMFGKVGPEDTEGGVRIGSTGQKQDNDSGGDPSKPAESEQQFLLGNLALFGGANRTAISIQTAQDARQLERTRAFEQLLQGGGDSEVSGVSEGIFVSRTRTDRSDRFNQLLTGGASAIAGSGSLGSGSGSGAGLGSVLGGVGSDMGSSLSAGSLFGGSSPMDSLGAIGSSLPEPRGLPTLESSPGSMPSLDLPAVEAPVSAPDRMQPRPVFLEPPRRGFY